MSRLSLCSLLLVGALLVVPAGLVQTTHGDNDKKDKKEKVAPPAKPYYETEVMPGEARPIRCKGHVKEKKIRTNH